MSRVIFQKVENKEEIEILAKKADIIWHEYFPSIITVEQIDYMVDMFLAPHSIQREIQEGYAFYLLYSDEENIGFMVVRPEEERLFISKLYVDKEHRGQGFGRPMFEKAREIAVQNNLKAMYLTVNKNNIPSIEVYKHKGFETIEEVQTDIGNGFIMDDYIMERKISKREIAMTNFKLGYNCAQAVVLAFSDEMGVDRKTLARLSSSFGGGMGRLREVCGSVSGMFLVDGMLYGYEDPKAFEEKAEHYAGIQELAAQFREKNGSIVCKELLGISGVQKPVPERRTEEYYRKRPCIELVGDAAEIMERYIVSMNVNSVVSSEL